MQDEVQVQLTFAEYELQEVCPYSHIGPNCPLFSERPEGKGEIKYTTTLSERQLALTVVYNFHRSLSPTNVDLSFFFQSQCLSSDPVNLSENDGSSHLILWHCSLCLTVKLFTSILVCSHLYQFTSFSIFSPSSSFLQLYEIIILHILIKYFLLVSYKIFYPFRRHRGWKECR